MTTRALQHAYPYVEADENEGGATYDMDTARLVYQGQLRIVRSRKRMRTLKRRGVPMMHLGYGDGTSQQQERSPLGNLVRQGPWAWFETDESAITRRFDRALTRHVRRRPWFERAKRVPKYRVTIGALTPERQAQRYTPPVDIEIDLNDDS